MQTVVALSTPRVPRLSYSPLSKFVFTFIKEVRVQHWCRVRLSLTSRPTFLEDFVAAIAVSTVLFAFAILFASAVLLFASIFVAIIVVAAIGVTAAILLLIFALLLTVVSIFVAAVGVAALRFEVVRSNQLLLFLPF